MKNRAVTFFGLVVIGLQAWLEPADGADAAVAETSTRLRSRLVAEGVSEGAIMGADPQGIPLVCGIPRTPLSLDGMAASPGEAGSALPPGTRSYEAIPSVIRSDGMDSFLLEVNAGGPVSAVRLQVQSTLVPASGNREQALRDDGQGGDRVGGDYIFTSEPMRYHTAFGQPGHLWGDTNSPHGLGWTSIGALSVVETNGATNQFLLIPHVGLLHTNIPPARVLSLAANLNATPHVINLRSARHAGQRALRSLDAGLEQLTRELYAAVPDVYDFLMWLTVAHVERLPRVATENFTAGLHWSVQVRFTGTGQGLRDSSAYYGSAGRLQGINILDVLQRGLYAGNATHELIHQWCAFISPALGLSEDCCHFSFRSSVGSLVGGQRWIDHSNGTFSVDCTEGRSGAHAASPTDRYMMGLIDGRELPLLRAFSSSIPTLPCDSLISNVPVTVSITNLQQQHGIRSPGPAAAQRSFALGFVVETHGRFLTPAEMTYYEILAEHYTRPWPRAAPAPYVGFNWVPISRFFGDDTTWVSHHPSLVRPSVSVAVGAAGRRRIFGRGFPGEPYTAEASTDLVIWTGLGTAVADVHGAYEVFDNASPGFPSRFYRTRWR